MTAYRIRACILFGLLGFVALPAVAETPSIQAPSLDSPITQAPTYPSDGRDASFLPPGSSDAAAPSQPVPLVSETAPAPANSLPAVTMPVTAPSAGETSAKSNVISQPVESEKLEGIDPDSVGMLTTESGGLGAAMWKGTPKELVTRVLPTVTLPTVSAALNGLAQRLLLTTANVPEGASDSTQTLTAMRVEKLTALGDAGDAWKLALLKPERVDEVTLRTTAEAALVSSEGKDVCAKLPDIIKTHTSPEWQKLQVVCQLRAGDSKGAQLSLEVLHTQDVKDDGFFDLAERNVIGGSKSLPRQLTPLKPLNLALLRLLDEALPPELFARPDAASIPELLQAKARDDGLRLGLAERAAARGIIGSTQLADAYKATLFPADQLTNALMSPEVGPRARSLLYQALAVEKTPQRRLDAISKFLQSLDTLPLNSAMAHLLAELISDIPITNDYTSSSAPDAARVFLMAGKPKEALAWLKIARQAPSVTAQLQAFWPLVVLAGVETDSDYSPHLHAWLDAVLKDADHDRHEQIGGVLLLFEATGYAVPEDAWARVIDASAAGRRSVLPPVLVLERLRTASTTNHRGETVLLALAAANAGVNESSILPAIETVRALRLIGLTSDGLMLAHETASMLLVPAKAGSKP